MPGAPPGGPSVQQIAIFKLLLLNLPLLTLMYKIKMKKFEAIWTYFISFLFGTRFRLLNMAERWLGAVASGSVCKPLTFT